MDYDQAATIYLKESQTFRYLAMINRIAFCYMEISQYTKAMDYVHQAINLNRRKTRTDSLEYAWSLNVTAGIYRKFGMIDLAIKNLELAFLIRQKFLSQRAMANTYGNLGILYTRKGEMLRAIEYHLLGLQLDLDNPETFHGDLRSDYRNLGTAYMYLGSNELALKNYQKAIEIGKEYLDPKNAEFGSIYANIGYLFWKNGEWEESLYYNKLALEVFEDWIDQDLGELSRVYSHLGITYRDAGSYEDSHFYFNKSKTYAQNVYGDKGSQISNLYRDIGILFYLQNHLDSALLYAQKSLIALAPDFEDMDFRVNPKIGNYYEAVDNTIDVLTSKAQTLIAIENKTGRLDYLIAALNVYQSCDTLIDFKRVSRYNLSDKTNLGNESVLVYKNAIDLCYELFIKTKDSKYVELAFYFNEKSKTGTLKEGVNSSNAKFSAAIPDSLVLVEESLRDQISFARSQLLFDDDSSLQHEYRQDLISAQRLLEMHIKSYERNYPLYFQLRHQTSVITIDELRSKLEPQTALIEYFVGTNNLYTFIINKGESALIKTPLDSAFEVMIAGFRSILRSSAEENQIDDNYLQQGFKIYQLLLAEPLNRLKLSGYNIDRLIFIPDGILGYVPFDLLLTSTVDAEDAKYHDLPYLIRDYTISYGYSSTILLRDYQKERTRKRKEYLGFAPSYNDLLTDSAQRTTLGHYRDAITDLSWNEDEVQKAAAYMQGEYYLSGEAIESAFKNQANNYKIIHLATHALVDDEEPMNSKLLFSQNDSIDDGYLHTYELYNMDIDSDLAVLSACNTGDGKLAKGEGIMSLGMGFAYAGCPSIVISHWNANDKTTADLMSLFYKHLADGEDKDVSLRLAKLEFLDQATADVSHPFYWGSFVVIGDTSPIDLGANSRREIMIGIGLLVISLLAFWMFFRNRITGKNLKLINTT